MRIRPTIRGVLAAATVAAAAATALPATAHADSIGALPKLPDGTKTSKTLVIGMDGTLLSRIRDADAPNLDRLMADGTTAPSSLYSEPMAPTLSGPGWSTIATGVWPDKHGVTDNSFSGSHFDRYPDFLTRLEQADPATSTVAISSWSPLTAPDGGNVFGPAVDVRLPTEEDDGQTADAAAHYLRYDNPDAAFVHFDAVDEAGHSHGADSQEYLDAIHSVDTEIGRLVDAVHARPDHAKEKWTIMVTADHGHTPAGGHGGDSWDERQTFLIADGPGFTPGSVRHDIRMTDIAPTVLAHEGVTPDPSWGLDGTAAGQLHPDDFDALRPDLRGPADETGIPAGTTGWTHTAPAGWRIDNSRMPSGGVTEWRGWSFATDDFWSRTQGGQGRENNVHARDVFAVADPDEWDDAAHGAGPFDSTLVSPDYPVGGRKSVTLGFATDYRQDGAQRGTVSVSFDGGPEQTLKTYSADVNGTQRLAVDVPAGARHGSFRFRCTGDNTWFWTVDQVRVTD